jgi:hypothetical protein
LIAVERLRSKRDQNVAIPIALRAVRVDGDGADTAEVAMMDHDQPQGWRGDGSFVVWGPPGLVEISLATGARSVLAETGAEVKELQVATGLLSELVIREPGDVDRGPWPWWARTLAALVAALLGLVTLALVLRYTLGRRRV